MKRVFAYSLLFATLLIACRPEEDEALLGRPEDRIDELLKGYKQQLVSSPYGWKGYVFPGLGGGFSFHFEFTSEGRVTMMADINSDCATESYESSFRMEMAQRPSVFFDTYSYLHILADPDPDTIGGVIGHGLMSDFEFAFESVHGDTLYLKGNQNGTPMTLIKATEEEAAEYKAGDVNTRMTDAATYAKDNLFVYLQANDGKRVNTSFNLSERKFALSYKQADSLNVSSVPFAYTSKGIFLQKPVHYKSTEFQEVFYDAAANVYYIEVDGTRTELRSSEDPVLPLNLLLGIDFSVISVPPKPMEGWSPIFLMIGGDIASHLGGAGLGLSYIEFDFNTENKTVNINVFLLALSSGRYYLAQYPYSYTKSSDGVFKFAPYDEPNGNAEYIQEVMDPLLYYFNTYRFRMEYFKTGNTYVAQMKCVENPSFYFTGNFGSALY